MYILCLYISCCDVKVEKKNEPGNKACNTRRSREKTIIRVRKLKARKEKGNVSCEA